MIQGRKMMSMLPRTASTTSARTIAAGSSAYRMVVTPREEIARPRWSASPAMHRPRQQERGRPGPPAPARDRDPPESPASAAPKYDTTNPPTPLIRTSPRKIVTARIASGGQVSPPGENRKRMPSNKNASQCSRTASAHTQLQPVDVVGKGHQKFRLRQREMTGPG